MASRGQPTRRFIEVRAVAVVAPRTKRRCRYLRHAAYGGRKRHVADGKHGHIRWCAGRRERGAYFRRDHLGDDDSAWNLRTDWRNEAAAARGESRPEREPDHAA